MDNGSALAWESGSRGRANAFRGGLALSPKGFRARPCCIVGQLPAAFVPAADSCINGDSLPDSYAGAGHLGLPFGAGLNCDVEQEENTVKRFKTLGGVLVLVMMWATSAQALVIDYAYVSTHDYTGMDQSTYDAIGQQTWLFTHASVGGNMLSGLDSLHSADSGMYQLTTPYASTGAPPLPLAPGSVYDVNRGNPGWANKYAIFEDMVQNGWGDNADFVMDKLCYIDQAADANVYLNMMETLDDQYPATFVYTTMPLRTGADSSNDLRNAYNEAVRAYALANDKLLFDIADLEAHDASGNEYTYISGSDVFQTLYSGWTSDGGHLNSAGAAWVAQGWYSVAASQTDPVPLPGALLLFGSGLLGVLGIRRRRIN